MQTHRPLRDSVHPSPHLHEAGRARALLADLEASLGADALTPPLRALLLAVADHSPFLWQVILRDPERFAALCAQDPDAAGAEIVARQRGVGRACGSNPDLAALGRHLRRNRAEHALLVALADLGGLWSLDVVTASLSAFADASVAAALDALLLQAAAAGRFTPLDHADPQAGSGLIVLGLGKLGGNELNYSSDIDLILFFEPEAQARVTGLDAKAFFGRIGQGMVRLLADRTEDGYVHRVDYRLRPDPGSTAIALSTAFAFDYYQTIGQTWERAAFIKARPIAGDLAAGRAFLAELRPFVWRKYFDFAAIAEIHAMKRQIHAVRGHETIAVAGHDIKRGRGGIREIEFFVQTQQLVFGGRQPALRGDRTVAMLEALVEAGWIDAGARDELAAAYAFLRMVEHRLQMVRDEQTQRLPAADEGLEAFARFAGFPTRAAFEAALRHHAGRVQAHYALLFEDGPEEADALAFGSTEPRPETLAALARLGFSDPGRAWQSVHGWQAGRPPALRAARAREGLASVLPLLLEALGGTPDPDAALNALDRAFSRMPAAAELLTILRAHEQLRLLFADLLGTAPRLAETVCVSPHVLDTVLEPDFVRPSADPGAVLAQYRAMVGAPADHEEFLDRCRDTTRQMAFVTGARLLSGIVSPEQAGAAYAAIADATIALCLEEETRRLAADHGTVPGGRACVLALGRLGSRQMTAESDLDLVILYDFDPEDRMSAGPRPLDAVVAYNRLAQRLCAALTTPTRRGRLYSVDLRLRPYGGHSPPAVQLRSFAAYHRDEAEAWEHMALTRARVMAGDAGLAAEVAACIAETVGAARDPAAICNAAGEMRALVGRERAHRGPYDLKLAPGGLLDLDFLSQALVLGHARALPELIGTDAAAALLLAGRRGLLPAAEAEALAESYRWLDGLHQWQRLMTDDPAATPAPAALGRLAAAMGAPDGRSLTARLTAERRANLRRLAAIRRRVRGPRRPAGSPPSA